MSRYPKFSDIGKDCRDLFEKGFYNDIFKLSVANSTCHGVGIKTSAIQENGGDFSADVEVKTTYPWPGLSSSHKWDLENNLKNEVSLLGLIPGGNIILEGNYNADTGDKGAAVKVEYGHKLFSLEGKLDGADASSLNVEGGVVTGYGGLLAGYNFNYDIGSGELSSNNMVFAFQHGGCGLFVTYENLEVLKGLYYHKVGRDSEFGAQMDIKGGENGNELAVAGKYVFNAAGHALRTKLTTKSILGLGLELKMSPGVTGFVSADVDLKNFTSGISKLGFGLDFGGGY